MHHVHKYVPPPSYTVCVLTVIMFSVLAVSNNKCILSYIFIPDTFTVDQAVDAIGFGKFQIKLSFFTGLVWVRHFSGMLHC